MDKMKERYTPVGVTLNRNDAPGKVTGLEKYAADLYPQGLLWAGVKRSDHAHALIKNINTDKGLAVPGVLIILTYKDIRGTNRMGVPEMDQPVLADYKVCYRGDPLALILGENKEAIRMAVEAVEIEYEVLPAVFDPEKALEPDAPVLHDNRPHKNLLMKGTVSSGGDVWEAFEQCYAVAEGEFRLPCQEHAYLETEAGVAVLTPDGILEITASTQTPFRDRNELAHALGMPAQNIRVIAPYLGGGFGGKDGITVQGLLGLAALHSGGRPVKIWNSREESFLSSTKRHRALVWYRLGCGRDGILQALSCKLILDTGAYASLGGPVTALALEHAAGVYRIERCLAEAYCVYTNNPVGGAFRGFGAPQVLGALEQVIDMLADKTGIDPLEFRLRNAVSRGDKLGTGVQMTNSTGILSCLQTVKEHPLWIKRNEWIKKAHPFKRRGFGLAAGMQGTGYGPMVPDIATAKIELLSDGRFKIYAGISDMGQGNNPTNIHLAGEILGQAPEHFILCQPDTFKSLPSGSSSASRTTYSYGNALITACNILKERILTRVCGMALGFRMHDLILKEGKVIHIPSGQETPLLVIASAMTDAERTGIHTYIAPVAGHSGPVSEEVRASGFPHLVFSFACHLARVEICELTGEISVCDYLAVTDGGRVLNPQIYRQQIQGGVVQGMGYALWEDFKVTGGEVISKNLATYILPTAMDVPDIISIPVETYEETGPYGMKGIGEIGINLPLPAIANAVSRGLGTRIFEAPLNAERVLRVLK